jgi:hypothetical protein
VTASAFRSKAEQDAKQEEDHVRGDDDGGVITGIDFHGRFSSLSIFEGEDAKENALFQFFSDQRLLEFRMEQGNEQADDYR